jgi:hypothetical protein
VEVDTPYADQLRDRYARLARSAVLRALDPVDANIPYEKIVDVALQQPMVCEKDLKDWLKHWRDNGLITLVGLKDREHTPKLDENHRVRKLRSAPGDKGSA